MVAGAVLSAVNDQAEDVYSEKFDQGRETILGMVGEFEVNFFHETLPLLEPYETIGKPYKEEAFEMSVRW